jgi:hypothetical protein
LANEKKHNDNAGLFIPAGLFLGLGFGFLVGNVVAWLLIGFGAGFVLMALSEVIKHK